MHFLNLADVLASYKPKQVKYRKLNYIPVYMALNGWGGEGGEMSTVGEYILVCDDG